MTNHEKAKKVLELFREFKHANGIGRDKVLTWEKEQEWKALLKTKGFIA